MIPDYAKGKASAIRILKLNNRQSKIDPQDANGIVLVSIYKSKIKLSKFIYLIENNDW